MDEHGGRGTRGPLDFANPVDVIVEGIIWQLRWAGRRVLTGVLLIAGLIVMSVAFMAPLIVAYAVIAVFNLAQEPNKWLGTIALVAGFVVGVIAAPLAIIRVMRRSRPLIALTQGGEGERDNPFIGGTSRTVAPGPSRAEWTAAVRALDDRLGTAPADPSGPISPAEDSPGGGGPPSLP